MMHGRGKSDSVIVAVRPTNKAGQSAERLVEDQQARIVDESAGQRRTLRHAA